MTQVVIVTGGAWGLGRAIAERFGAARARVAFSYYTHAREADEVVAAIGESGGEALARYCDVRDFEQVKALVAATVERWGRVDVLVNNAGGQASPFRDRYAGFPLTEVLWEDWDYIVDSNLKGAFHGIKAVAPQMVQQGEGHIISISSGTGIKGRAGFGHYAAAKAGIIGLTKSVARELGGHNIKVNCVCPGVMHHTPEEARQWQGSIRTDYLLGRPSNAKDNAEAVYRVAQMPNVSGQIMVLESRIVL